MPASSTMMIQGHECLQELLAIERRGAAGELLPGLFQAIAMLGTPSREVAQCRHGVDELECQQPAYDFRRIEQIAGQHRDHALLDLPDIARLAEDPSHDRTVE